MKDFIWKIWFCLVTWFNCIFTRIDKGPIIGIWTTQPTNCQPFYKCDIVRMNVFIKQIYIPKNVAGSIKYSTLRDEDKASDWFFGVANLGRGAGSHRSVHTEIDCPFPTLLISLFNQISSWTDASPAIRWWVRSVWTLRICIPKITTFKSFWKQTIWIVY